jgi:hypothetical protein
MQVLKRLIANVNSITGSILNTALSLESVVACRKDLDMHGALERKSSFGT